MDLISWFPSVVVFGVALPFDQILEAFDAPILSMIHDALDFKLFFSINEVW
jgi:hypothetical protein